MFAGALAQAGAPKRVVSINLCTDQHALLVADPGQIVSLSRRSHDPAQSALWERARAFPVNGSQAEEIFLLKPDLVLAGTFNNPATIRMLQSLGVRVELFAPETRLTDIAANLRKMGAVLGRDAQAKALARAVETRLAALADQPEHPPRAALYYINAYAPGSLSLDSDVLTTAGFQNVASEVGAGWGGTLPLERLLLLEPDVVFVGQDYPGHARGEEVLHHPALEALNLVRLGAGLGDGISARNWSCGTPRTLDAVEALRDIRLRMDVAQ